MKYLILAFLLVSVSVNAESSKIKACKSLENLAIAIMKARQADIPMSKLYEINLAKNNPLMDKAVKQMIVDAYKMPSFTDPQIKEKMIKDYGNTAFLQCVE